MSINSFHSSTHPNSDKSAKRKVALERGKRVKLARSLVNLTRKDMLEKYNINPNTINAWEQGTNCLTEKNAFKLFEAFQQEGLLITTEWLLYGENPNLSNTFTLENKNKTLQDILNIRGDLKILDEINYFRQNNINSTSVMISDDALFPIFCAGDYVGGINLPNKNWEELIGQFCIILTEDEQVLTRKIFDYRSKNVFMVGSINPFSRLKGADCFSCKIRSVAQITRHWYLSRMLNQASL
jgi:DNA-binding transcriptional regulator YiaG